MKIIYGSMDAAAFELSQRSARYSIMYIEFIVCFFNTEPTVSTIQEHSMP